MLLVRFETRLHRHLGRCCIVSAVPHVRIENGVVLQGGAPEDDQIWQALSLL